MIPVIYLVVPDNSGIFIGDNRASIPVVDDRCFFATLLATVFNYILFTLVPVVGGREMAGTSRRGAAFGSVLTTLGGGGPFRLIVVSCFLNFNERVTVNVRIRSTAIVLNDRGLITILNVMATINSVVDVTLYPLLVGGLGREGTCVLLSICNFTTSVFSFTINRF